MKPIKPFTVPASTVKSPPVYKPTAGVMNGKLAVARRPLAAVPFAVNHPANARISASGTVERRAAPPVYRPNPPGLPPSVQPRKPLAAVPIEHSIILRMQGGSYFSGNDKDAQYRKNAEKELGKTPGHGSSTDGKNSGMNRATMDHEAKINEHIRAQKEKEYKDSRPKAVIKSQAPMEDYEKALATAERMKNDFDNSGIRHTKFQEYLVNRGFNFNEDEIVELETALGLYD